MTPKSAAPLDVLRRFAPGTPLREAVDLILRQGSGALIVIGSGPDVDGVSTGGFRLDDAPFTAQRVAELAKMDGGLVVDDEAGFINRANVHFIPDPTIRTDETGTRFRTAERLALQVGRPVLAVSEEGRRFAVVYTNGDRFVLQDPTSLLAEANQRLQSLERLRRQLDEAEDRLTRYEIDDVAVLRDAVVVIQRAALILRLLNDLETIAVELGDEASLIRIQASDLVAGVELLAELVNYDYQARRPRKGTAALAKLDELAPEDLYHTATVGAALGLTPLDEEGNPRGARALARIPRLPVAVRDGLIRRFGSLRKLLAASVEELSSVEGVGTVRAKQIKTYLDRLDEVRLMGDFAE
jgi:diadenylate cyclase